MSAFALDEPGHFSVMFSPELVDTADATLTAAQAAALNALAAGAAGHAAQTGRQLPAHEAGALPPYALLAWAAAHGVAQLALAGSLTKVGLGSSRGELLEAARQSLKLLGP